jgi:hypothetical protein
MPLHPLQGMNPDHFSDWRIFDLMPSDCTFNKLMNFSFSDSHNNDFAHSCFGYLIVNKRLKPSTKKSFCQWGVHPIFMGILPHFLGDECPIGLIMD